MEVPTAGRVLLTLWYFASMIFSASSTVVFVSLEAVLFLPLWILKGKDFYITELEKVSGLTCNFFARVLLLNSYGWKIEVVRVQSYKISANDKFVIEESNSADTTPDGLRKRIPGKEKNCTTKYYFPGKPWSFLDFTNCGVSSDGPGAEIVMSNHLTNSDPFVWRAAMFPWATKFLYKRDLQWIPFLGQCLPITGDVAVHFTKAKGGWGVAKGSTQRMMERCKRIISRGCNMFVFPEGGRGSHKKMLPLRQGFIRLAVENGYSIKPVAIWGSQDAWPNSSFWLDFATITLIVPEDVIDCKGKTCEMVTKETTDALLNMLSICPGFDRESAQPLPLEEFAPKSTTGSFL